MGSDPDQLASILKYHTIPRQALTGRDIAVACIDVVTDYTPDVFEDSEGLPVELERVQLYTLGSNTYVNGSQADPAKVLRLVPVGRNSALAIIDRVLLPAGVAEGLYAMIENGTRPEPSLELARAKCSGERRRC